MSKKAIVFFIILSGVFVLAGGIGRANEDVEVFIQTGHTQSVNSVAISPDDTYIVSGSSDETVRIWDRESGKQIKVIQGFSHDINLAAITPDGNYIVFGSGKTIHVWNKETDRPKKIGEHGVGFYSVAISSDGKDIITGGRGTIRIWDIKTGRQKKTLMDHSNWNVSVAISHDGDCIVSGSSDGKVIIWDKSTGVDEDPLKGHSSSVNSVAISRDGKSIVSGSKDATIRIWERRTGDQLKILKWNIVGTSSMAASSDGKYIVCGGGEKIRIWERETGRLLQTLKARTESVYSVAINRDGKYIVSGDRDHKICIWKRETGEQIQTLTGHSSPVLSTAISPDSKQIVSGSGDKTVRIWDRLTGNQLKVLRGHELGVTSVAISSDGRYIVSGSVDRTVRIWDKRTGTQLKKMIKHNGKVNSVAISPDGNYIVSGGSKDVIRIWDRETGNQVGKFGERTDDIESVAISPDGRYIISGSRDTIVRIWDRETGQEVKKLEGHIGYVESVAFAPDGNTIFSGSDEGSLKIWDAKEGKLLATLISFDDEHWVTYTPDNYYISSPQGDKYISFRVGKKIYSFEQYSEIYKKEEVVSRVLRGEESNKVLDELQIKKEVITRIPPPVAIINHLKINSMVIENKQTVDSPNIVIKATADGQDVEIYKMIILLNGKPIDGSEKVEINKKRVTIEEKVALVEGKNLIRIMAVNMKNVKGYSEEFTLVYKKVDIIEDMIRKGKPLNKILGRWYGKEQKSWAVVIGIDKYQKKSGFNNLKYAVNDARKVKEYLVKYLDFDEKRIIDLYDEDATKENIEQTLGDILPAKVGKNDRVVIYFSCHGALQKVTEEINFGYLIPYDGKENSFYSTCISMKQLEHFSEMIRARQVLFILDCCYSGVAGLTYKTRKKIPNSVREQIELFIRSNGRQLITAGASEEK